MYQLGKIITIGNYSVATPTLFASYRLGDYPSAGLRTFPWKITETEGLLINAYDFNRPRFKNVLENGWAPATHLDFADKPIIIDSGAYYFLRHENIKVTPEDILSLELKSQAHIGVILDHPFPPNITNREKAKRINTTIKNTERMFAIFQEQKTTMQILPVVHGHTPRTIRNCIKRIKNLADKYDLGETSRVGIGSVAPLAKYGNGKLAFEIIHTVRQELPTAHIHCFSMGSALSMLLAFYSGADSVDSQSWMVSAAFKLAQLPGHYVMRLANRAYDTEAAFQSAKKQFSERLKRLYEEENYSVKNWQTGKLLELNSTQKLMQYVENLADVTSNENVHNRACHNLWTYNFEVKQARNALKKNQFEKFVQSRLENTRYKSAFEYARTQKRQTKRKITHS